MALIERIVRRSGEESAVPSAVVRRLALLSEPEIVDWIDTTVVSAGRNTLQGVRSERPEFQAAYLSEAESDAHALIAMLQELRKRRGL